MATNVLKNTSQCLALASLNATINQKPHFSVNELSGILLVIGVLWVLLAVGYVAIRKVIYKDKNTLDTSFDAGGKVSVGLTATTIVSQWTWTATLLQSTTVASKYGISGPFWYAAGATVQILLFAMLSIQLKIKAPGAKTFLQVIHVRFGRKTHIVFCIFALMTNVVVTSMLMLGGSAVLTSTVENLSVELATGMVCAVIGAYTFIGGLGATFYVSYFNTAIIFTCMMTFLVKVYHQPDNPGNPLGSVERVYDLLSCSVGPDGNKGESYLTMLSNPGLMFGVINIVGNFGTVFVDQSYWQSSVAAKPKQGVWGFLFGGLVWFAVPFTFATTMGLAYIALTAKNGEALLPDDDVNAGLVAPVVAKQLMGSNGEFLIIILVLMAVTSTGSAEIIAVTSILVYDIYYFYYKPFRQEYDASRCILCGHKRQRHSTPDDRCSCTSMTHCLDCKKDDKQKKLSTDAIKPPYECLTHGPYRTYTDYLNKLKSWGILWTTVAIIPLTMILFTLNVSLGWVYLFMGILVGSAVIPISLSIYWKRLTGAGMMAGAICGTILGIVAWLSVASTYDGGLGDFLHNTGREESMLCGNLVAILSGGIICVVVSLFTSCGGQDPDSADDVWEKTRDIDSPLRAWTELYERDLNLKRADELDSRPPLAEVQKAFRWTKFVANAGALSLTLILVIIWPAVTTTIGVFDLNDFKHWLNVSQAWGIIGTVFIIIMPLLNELMEIRGAVNKNRKDKQVDKYSTNNGKESDDKQMEKENEMHDNMAFSGRV